jgi:hypothetical protein
MSVTHRFRPLLGLLLAGALSAQIYVPATSVPQTGELNSRTNYPLMRLASRSQFVIANRELGVASAQLTQIALRYDGPSFDSAGGTLGDVQILLAPASGEPSASTPDFAGNVQGQLVQVAQRTNHVFPADDDVNWSKWGGNNGELTFLFSQPFPYAGGPLVVEIRASGNSNAGTGVKNCLLDAEVDPLTGAAGGTSSSLGTGCTGALLSVLGQLAPGGVVSTFGSGFGASSPVAVYLGASRAFWGSIPLPLALDPIGMNGCSVYSDLLVGRGASSDANGSVAAWQSAFGWPVPATTALQGGLLQFQAVAIKTGANALGVVTSNNVQVTLGSYVPLQRGFVGHFHHEDRDAPLAAHSAPLVAAMRFN